MKKLELQYLDHKAPGMIFMVVIRHSHVREAKRWLKANNYQLWAFKALVGGK